MNCVLCGCELTERQRLGQHHCCAPCLLKTMENNVEDARYERHDDPSAPPPAWLPVLVVATVCGFLWGLSWLL